MTTLENLEHWVASPAENEHLEFKEAKMQFGKEKTLKYCAAIANEGGGHLVLGVTNKLPRTVVGTSAFSSDTSVNEIKTRIFDKFKLRVDVKTLQHADGRVLVFEIPSRPVAHPISFEGTYLMRIGEDLVPMSPDVLKKSFRKIIKLGLRRRQKLV